MDSRSQLLPLWWTAVALMSSAAAAQRFGDRLNRTAETAAPPREGATFFFTQVEPHRFEYRAMFRHGGGGPVPFRPFVDHFDHFPPLPKFPDFPPLPRFPDLRELLFPVPVVKRSDAPAYPKIFRFNEERVNIVEFERDKKRRRLKKQRHRNGLLDDEADSVERSHLLVLHGGVFTLKDPPLHPGAKKRRTMHGG